MININSFKFSKEPWGHFKSTNCLKKETADLIRDCFPDWENNIWENHGKTFETEYGLKKELTNREVMPKPLQDFIESFESQEIIKKIQEMVQVDELIIDKSLYGGGLNIFQPGSTLKPHIDYNFDDSLKAYRVVNLIYYISDDWDEGCGGTFDLYNKSSEKMQSIPPLLNNCLFFKTGDNTPHGVSKTKLQFYRRSIAFWYYSKKSIEGIKKDPHKTIWFNNWDE